MGRRSNLRARPGEHRFCARGPVLSRIPGVVQPASRAAASRLLALGLPLRLNRPNNGAEQAQPPQSDEELSKLVGGGPSLRGIFSFRRQTPILRAANGARPRMKRARVKGRTAESSVSVHFVHIRLLAANKREAGTGWRRGRPQGFHLRNGTKDPVTWRAPEGIVGCGLSRRVYDKKNSPSKCDLAI